jgi:hypothetical protein
VSLTLNTHCVFLFNSPLSTVFGCHVLTCPPPVMCVSCRAEGGHKSLLDRLQGYDYDPSQQQEDYPDDSVSQIADDEHRVRGKGVVCAVVCDRGGLATVWSCGFVGVRPGHSGAHIAALLAFLSALQRHSNDDVHCLRAATCVCCATL